MVWPQKIHDYYPFFLNTIFFGFYWKQSLSKVKNCACVGYTSYNTSDPSLQCFGSSTYNGSLSVNRDQGTLPWKSRLSSCRPNFFILFLLLQIGFFFFILIQWPGWLFMPQSVRKYLLCPQPGVIVWLLYKKEI